VDGQNRPPRIADRDVDEDGWDVIHAGMNVLDEQKRQQVLALGRMGWSRRRIERVTGVRPGDGQRGEWPAKAATRPEVSTDSGRSKPATTEERSTDSGIARWPPAPKRSPRSSACEPFRELITEALARGRNAMAIWQDLVDDHGFARGT
jgi:hypothetical protein